MDTGNVKDTNTRSLLPRTFAFAIFYTGVVVTLFGIVLWYGRNTYGPGNSHPASVSEVLGPLLSFLLGVGIAGLVTLTLVVLYWLASLVWLPPLRNRKNQRRALMIGLPVTLVTTIVLCSVVRSID